MAKNIYYSKSFKIIINYLKKNPIKYKKIIIRYKYLIQERSIKIWINTVKFLNLIKLLYLNF